MQRLGEATWQALPPHLHELAAAVNAHNGDRIGMRGEQRRCQQSAQHGGARLQQRVRGHVAAAFRSLHKLFFF